MELKKRKGNILLTFLILLFIFFIALYSSQISGYYEYNEYRKSNLTKEKIEEFENDIKNGVDVENKNYVLNEYKDYSNPFSKVGLTTSRYIEKTMTKGIKMMFGKISDMVLEE